MKYVEGRILDAKIRYNIFSYKGLFISEYGVHPIHFKA